jgi:hypothetical protein
MFLGSQHFGGKGACWSFGMGTKKSDKHQLLTWTCTNQTTSWLMHSLNTFDVKTSHGQTRTHKTHHSLDLGESTTFPLIVYFVPLLEAHIQMAFCLRTPKWESRNSLWGPHNFACRAPIEMRFKKKLYLSSRAFQQYVACHLHARKSGQF